MDSALANLGRSVSSRSEYIGPPRRNGSVPRRTSQARSFEPLSPDSPTRNRAENEEYTGPDPGLFTILQSVPVNPGTSSFLSFVPNLPEKLFPRVDLRRTLDSLRRT